MISRATNIKKKERKILFFKVSDDNIAKKYIPIPVNKYKTVQPTLNTLSNLSLQTKNIAMVLNRMLISLKTIFVVGQLNKRPMIVFTTIIIVPVNRMKFFIYHFFD